LGLQESSLSAAVAAVESETRGTTLSMDGIVQRITDKANHAYRLKIPNDEFLESFLAQVCARRVLGILNLSITDSSVSRLASVLKAEAKDTGLTLEETAQRVTEAASGARQRGEKVNLFYFEDFTWRSNARASKAEQRKLGNLAANARAKEILRERLR
jgi:hypothetical protein